MEHTIIQAHAPLEQIDVTPRIKLSAPLAVHAAALFRLVADHRGYLSRFLDWPRFVESVDDTLAFLEQSARAHRDGVAKTFVMLLDEVPCGTLSFNRIDAPGKTAELGYWLSPQAQGQGVVTQSVEALVRRTASKGAITRFVIKCSTRNLGSNAVARRCGFTHEAVLHKAEEIGGVWHDQNVYVRIIDAA